MTRRTPWAALAVALAACSGEPDVPVIATEDIRQHIEGDEQFLPPTRQRTFGAFTVQHTEIGDLRLEAGARFERNRLKADASAVIGNPAMERSFSTLSFSLGGRYAVTSAWSFGLSLARCQRAPSIEERPIPRSLEIRGMA